MATGGTWTLPNKKRPGVYFNFKSARPTAMEVNTDGIVALCEPLDWGPVAQVMELEPGTDPTPYTGYDLTAAQNLFLRQIFAGTNRTPAPGKLLLYRPAAADSAAASATVSQLTATALYPGRRGNDLRIVVTEQVEPEGSYLVSTVLDGSIVDRQTAKLISDLVPNDWVRWSGTGSLTATVGTALTGGANGTVSAPAHSAFLTAIEPYPFKILIYDGSDSTVRTAYELFIRRLNESTPARAQLVCAEAGTPDSEMILNVTSGVTLEDGTALTPQQVCWWVGGARAGAGCNKSLTNAVYPDAVDVTPRRKNSEYEAGLDAGQFMLTPDEGVVRVEQDINSLVTFLPEKGKEFRYNRTVDTLNTIARDVYRYANRNLIGALDTDDNGKRQLKTILAGYLIQMQDLHAIQNVDTDADIQVENGSDLDTLLVALAVQVVGTAEKIYIAVTVS